VGGGERLYFFSLFHAIVILAFVYPFFRRLSMASELWTFLRTRLLETTPTANLWWELVEKVAQAEKERELLADYLVSHVRSDRRWRACAVARGRWDPSHPGREWSESLSCPLVSFPDEVEIYCPPGTYTLGAAESDHEASSYEGPQRNVTLTQGFWALSTPVTQKLYEAVMGENPSAFLGEDHPVEMVSWFDAVVFCNRLSAMAGLKEAYVVYNYEDWIQRGRPHEVEELTSLPGVLWDKTSSGYRLPTEAEWETLCRAGSVAPRYGPLLQITQMEMEQTFSVKSRRPNAWGFYDTLGNVWEWVYDNLCTDKERLPTIDPIAEHTKSWPSCGLRGAAWHSDKSMVAAYTLGSGASGEVFNAWGFRCVRTAVSGEDLEGGV
jgi:formylglycine-generating enzyme required for sulfatase activity